MVSTKSKSISISILDPPEITISAGYAVWDAVTSATAYDIYINGTYIETITDNRYRRPIGEGLYLTVVAKNGNSFSKLSTPIDVSTD